MKRNSHLGKLAAISFTILMSFSLAVSPAFSEESILLDTTVTELNSTDVSNPIDAVIPTAQFLKLVDDQDGSSAVLISENQDTILILSGKTLTGLSGQITEQGIRKINHLILAGAEGQEGALQELLSVCTVENFYTAGNDAAVSVAKENDINVETSDYFQIGDVNIILYTDDEKNIGVLAYTPQCAMFVADSMEDMSGLKAHGEVGYLSILSISSNTGLDPDVLHLMNPGVCIISGNVPDAVTMGAFHDTTVAEEGKFYLQGNAAFGITVDMSYSHEIMGAIPKSVDYEWTETHALAGDENLATEDEGDLNLSSSANTSASTSSSELGEDGYVHGESFSEGVNGQIGVGTGTQQSTPSEPVTEAPTEESVEEFTVETTETAATHQKSNEEVALEIINGQWGRGQERYNSLREAGYDPDVVQSVVDGLASHPEKQEEVKEQIAQAEAAALEPETEPEAIPSKPQYVTITIYAPENTGTEPQVVEVELGATFTPNPSWTVGEGYLLEGWYTDPEYTNAYDASAGVSGNMALYPQITPITYTIEFDSNNGDGTMDEMSCVYGQEYQIPDNSFTKRGYRFAGWNTEQEDVSMGTSFVSGSTVKNLTSRNRDTVTLYAQWELVHEVAIGKDQTVRTGGEAEFFIDGNINEFISAVIGNHLLPASSMSIEGDENQIHIILDQDTIREIGEGDYLATFNFTDGSCQANVVIDRQEEDLTTETAKAKPAENDLTTIYLICGAAAVIAILLAILVSKKLKKDNQGESETSKRLLR